MLPKLLTILSAATGVFTGSAICERMPDGVIVELSMNVESKEPRVPADSISGALQKVLEATKTFGLKEPYISVTESSEGPSHYQNKKGEEEKTFYARKGIRIRTPSFLETSRFLEYAALQGFMSTREPSFYIENTDSLQSACLEKATRHAILRATAAKKALNGTSMSILKITDTDKFSLHTSDDTQIGDENVDAFFGGEERFGSGVVRGVIPRPRALFYKIVPEPRTITANVKVLVKIETAD